MTLSPPLRLPRRTRDAHKGTFGRVLLIGGSRGMSGSIAMTATASLKSGAGLVTAAIPDRCLETVAAFHPAIMTLPIRDTERGVFAMDAASQLSDHLAGRSAVGCGPGMTTEDGAMRVVERVLQARSVATVLDADGLNCLARLIESGVPSGLFEPSAGKRLVLTPHPGELQRLTGVSSRDRDAQVDSAIQLSNTTGAVIVVKGGPTVVVRGSEVWTNVTGNPGMATAGSGDVLTGVITALLGQGLSAWDAGRLGVWIHGYAGDLAASAHGQIGMTATEILDALPAAVRASEAQ